jgi:nickel-dependent lactate racemase
MQLTCHTPIRIHLLTNFIYLSAENIPRNTVDAAFLCYVSAMQLDVAFGKSGMSLDLPGRYEYRVLEARSASPVPDERAAIEAALDSPIGCPPLAVLARGCSTAAISVCDITRPAPNPRTLPPLLDRLHRAGVPHEGVTILIATGLHRPATPEEIDQIVSPEIAAHYRVVNHFARELLQHRHLGSTQSGTPVYIDERFISADLHITLGFIEPHLMLGYSGGRKLIAPGLAAQETIKVLHSPKFMRDKRTHEGSIEDNPLHGELLEIASMARHDFMLDVALTRSRQIAGVFAGHAREAHAAGVRFVSRVLLEELDQPADAVITTAAGYPLDLTFYQSVKGITAAQHVLKPGGRILLIAACQEGPGAEEFSRMLKEFPSAPQFMDAIASSPVIVDQWQLEKLALVTERADIHYYVPGLPADYYPSLWGQAHATVESALDALFDGLPAGARVALIPEGPYVLAKAAGLVTA